MIEIKKVTKIYGKNIGNFNISININNGEIYGILGPNGAGKTTLIRQIMGFIKSDAGVISFNNLNPWLNSKEIMEDTGYLSGEISLYENLKGIEYLKLIKNFRPKVNWKYVEKLILHFELNVNTKIKKMSKGMKQKLAIIAAVMHKPKFLILDEPTSGLDPVMQDQFNELILKMREKNKTTIIICSHIFDEIAKLCDRVGFIKQGKLIEEMKIDNKNMYEIEKHFKKLYERERVL
ncbi:ABC transporter ATP-binding protein [Spiroplasma syrphidicola EA-1]|uniref:ABC transporter ATP-binding protein n=1 Tax=Spiroplasma syrphidicola EA-1 TaxID=1276229 RepID=R4U7E5_9MOLU|nr:ATP-binding cassette domain-containing protein [Spiroplasma syrphidicola]AGM26573.1 ABC transporter ATP-binding protein [Spiroplasma syrphidicola EA-1]